MKIAQQLFNRALQDMSGSVAHSWRRQEESIKQEIGLILDRDGLDFTIDVLKDAVSFDQTYNGKAPFYGDMFSALGELRTSNVDRDSREFRAQVQAMGDRNLMHSYKVGDDGQAIKLDGSAYVQAQGAEQKPMPQEMRDAIREALDTANYRLDEAQRNDDQYGISSAQRSIANIERQIAQASNPPIQQRQQASSNANTSDGPLQQADDDLWEQFQNEENEDEDDFV